MSLFFGMSNWKNQIVITEIWKVAYTASLGQMSGFILNWLTVLHTFFYVTQLIL